MARQGDADFPGSVSTSRDGLRATAFLLCGDWHLADDLVQDALTRVFGIWGRVSGSGDPAPYARKVLVNLYLDHRRRPSRRETPTADLPDLALDQPLGVDGDRDRLMAALRRVPKGQRAVLVLRYWPQTWIGRKDGTPSFSITLIKRGAQYKAFPDYLCASR